MRPEAPLSEALMRAFEARAEAEQIVFRSRSGARQAFRGADLSSMAGEMAQTLQLWLGSAPCRIVVALPAGPDFVTLLLGGVLAGVTVVPVPVPRHGSHTERFRHIVADSRASAVICLPEHLGIITAELTRQGPASCPVVPLPLNPARLPEPTRAAGDTARLAVIQYTSGSTRFPKGVAITGDNILANAGLVARSWGLGPASRFVNWLPHYHDMGLMGGILTPLLCGGFSAQMSPLDFIRKPALWPEAVSDERATISGGPAFAFAECVQRVTADQIAGMDLSTWSRAFCGAEPVPAELPELFHAHFAPAGLSRAAALML
ncbi:AMP-binding protein [Allosediminivita pacifica]|uniref:AMP-binding enzyme n=1 Tax=Allosediminivita pacifica TaxID=1267769 RepID=A0A2T6APU6_9RHOB|nr:AMP-binding protein [Allosediminivita pacifica]PTX45843.1 AMP-binding enzyme [Allosediminivita pacifica]GGB19767.1 hypothetical protein GCM10011324_32320 [Allosediminivita pacifica]